MRATRNRPVYTNEFKTEAVALARRDDRTFRELAEDLGVSVWTLRHWYKMDEMAKRKTKKADAVSRPAVLAPESESLKERAARLERELAAAKRLSAAQEKKIASLETDREILKKAAAFFAKESE